MAGGALIRRALRALALAAVWQAALAPAVLAASEVTLDSALTLWLSNDEAAALPDLARLAASGDVSAQILLTQIDRSAALQGPWLLAQSRDARIALLRPPADVDADAGGDAPGGSWMAIAAASSAVAEDLLAVRRVDAGPEVAMDLIRRGEARAGREALLAIAGRGRYRLSPVAAAPEYPPSLRYLLWREWSGQPAQLAQLTAEIAAMAPDDVINRAMTGAPVAPEALTGWLLQSSEAAPVAALCADLCPEAPGNCAQATIAAIGNPLTVLTLGSPAETIVTAEHFNHSARGHSAVLRRIMLGWTGRGREARMGTIAAADACLAAAVTEEAARPAPK